MTFTAGLLLVFLNIFLSGLIFLRFYFVGEFSKQFNTRIPIVRLAFYALIPGLILFSLGIIVYQIVEPSFKLSQALEIYGDLLNSKGSLQNQTKHFLNENLYLFVCYNLCIYVAAIAFGLIFHYLVQKWDWDKRTKLLRFKNYWYYVFSGEILKFKKFLRASVDIQFGAESKDQKTIITYADILCDDCGQTKLYTGYLVDYELDSENMHHLDKIYLLDAQRYEKCSQKNLRFQSWYDLKEIHGHLFVVDYRNVLNLNLTYVPSYHQLERIDNIKNRQSRFVLNSLSYLRLPFLLFLIDFIATQQLLKLETFTNLAITPKVIAILALFTCYSFIFKMLEHLAIKGRIQRLKSQLSWIRTQNEKSRSPLNTEELLLKTVGLSKLLGELGTAKNRTNKMRNTVMISFLIYTILFIVYMNWFG